MKTELLIVFYIDTYLFPPSNNWQSYYFVERSAARWAAFEILDLILDNPDIPYNLLLENQIKLYKDAAESTGDREKNLIFEVAEETAIDILTMLEREKKHGQNEAV